MNIGVFGGSFNPIHEGHCMVASYIAQYSPIVDEVWLLVTPVNPIKNIVGESYDCHRVEMAKLAVEGAPFLKVCDIEFSLSAPFYTIRTLDALQEQYPEHRFRLIIGSDNWVCFDRWKDSERIISDYGVIVYPRPNFPCDEKASHANVEFVDAPQIDISSTFVRNGLREGKDMSFFLPDKVEKYIKNNNLYSL